MHLAVDGEVWIAAEPVDAIFGFNVDSHRWDREINLPFEPTMFSRITEPTPGVLLVNGVILRGNERTSHLARILEQTGALAQLTPSTDDYIVADANNLVYIDDFGTVSTFDLQNDHTVRVVAGAPLNRPTAMALDLRGDLWFAMAAYRSVGVGKLNLARDTVATFPFPYIDRPGVYMPNDCPTGAIDCIPSSAVFTPGVTGMVIDSNDNVWVVTGAAGRDVEIKKSPAAMYELLPGSRSGGPGGRGSKPPTPTDAIRSFDSRV